MTTPRRRFLKVCSGITGSSALAGCLRLTSESENTNLSTSRSSTANQRTSKSETTSESSAVELVREWSATDLLSSNLGDSVVSAQRRNRSILAGQYKNNQSDSVQLITFNGTTQWQGPAVPQSHTVYRSSISGDETRIIVGFPRESRYTFAPDNATNAGALVHCYDASSGDLLWEYETDSEYYFLSSLAVTATGTVCVATDVRGTQDIRLYGVDIDTGEVLWQQSELLSDVTVDRITDSIAYNDTWFVSSYYGVFQLDSESGDVLNQYRRPDAPYFSLSLDGSDIYGTDSAAVVRFDANSATGMWRTEMIGNGSGSRNCIVTDTAVFATDNDGYVYAINKENGEQSWEQRIRGDIDDVALTNEYLWVSNTTGGIQAYDQATGSTVTSQRSVSAAESASEEQIPLVGWDNLLFIGGDQPGAFSAVPKG